MFRIRDLKIFNQEFESQPDSYHLFPGMIFTKTSTQEPKREPIQNIGVVAFSDAEHRTVFYKSICYLRCQSVMRHVEASVLCI